MTATSNLLNYNAARLAMRHVSAMELHLSAIMELVEDVDTPHKQHPLAVAAAEVMMELENKVSRPIYRAFPEFDPEKDVLRLERP